MKKKSIYIGICVCVCGVIVWMFTSRDTKVQKSIQDVAYVLEGQTVQMKDGQALTPIQKGSLSSIRTTYTDIQVQGDINEDGFSDTVLFLTQESGGSGVFYYLVAALGQKEGYIGTSGIFLGDRIFPVDIRVEDRKIIVQYADREKGEPMSAEPTIRVRKEIKLLGTELVEY